MATSTSIGNPNVATLLRFLARVADTAPRGAYLEELKRVSSVLPEGASLWARAEEDGALFEESLLADWTRLFRGLSAGYGPRPPYQLVFRPAADEGKALLAIKKLYGSCGLAVSDQVGDRPDHLSLLLDCAAALATDESVTPDSNEGDRGAPLTFEAFALRYLNWVPSFCKEARPYAETEFYRWYFDLLEEVVGGLLAGAREEVPAKS